MNVVLMAGGGGTRLWPLSRRKDPKQFLDLGSGKTLLQHTYERAKNVADESHIFVATVAEYADRVSELLPAIPQDHIFLEPTRRDTAPAFAATAIQLQLLGQGAEPTLFMWSDHVFTAEQEFVSDIKKIEQLLRQHPDHVVILGHTPTSPETGFGYMEVGEQVQDDIYKVVAFKEKPDSATAEKYVAAGAYFWNMGYISLTPDYLLQELQKHTPDLFQGIQLYAKHVKEKNTDAANDAYSDLSKIAIDYALLEKTTNIFAITGDYGWSDVGNWKAVQEIFGVQGDYSPKGHHVHVDSQGNYVYNATGKAVSLIGMKDTIVVVTDDALLVTDKNSSHLVKDVVARLEKEDKTDYI